MSNLVLHKFLGVAELDQVRYIRVPEGVQVERFGKSSIIPSLFEGFVDTSPGKSAPAFSHPKRRVTSRRKEWTCLRHPLLKHGNNPVHFGDGEYSPALGCPPRDDLPKRTNNAP